MPLPGFGGGDERVRRLAHDAAVQAATLARVPEPHADSSVVELLAAISRSLSAIAEARSNEAREVARLRDSATTAARREPVDVRPPPPEFPRGVLALADLRDRLRVLDAQPGAGEPGDESATLSWMVERLDDTLSQLGVQEFVDVGPLNPLRHQVVDRRIATPGRPAATIAQSVRSGLLFGGEVLRPQQVAVYTDDQVSTDG